jgi:DNA-binding transcriptional regulator YbjK
MAFRPDTNRPATLERRDAVLDAAIAVIGESGLGAVTHRAIAAKAGVPVATTSYFFASIDELMVEAMRRVADKAIAGIEAATSHAATEQSDPREAIDRLVDVLLAEPEAETIAQFETYLEAARRPELRREIERVLDAFEELARVTMQTLGAPVPPHVAKAFVALADGFALHRLAARRDDNHAQAFRDAFVTLFEAYSARR